MDSSELFKALKGEIATLHKQASIGHDSAASLGSNSKPANGKAPRHPTSKPKPASQQHDDAVPTVYEPDAERFRSHMMGMDSLSDWQMERVIAAVADAADAASHGSDAAADQPGRVLGHAIMDSFLGSDEENEDDDDGFESAASLPMATSPFSNLPPAHPGKAALPPAQRSASGRMPLLNLGGAPSAASTATAAYESAVESIADSAASGTLSDTDLPLSTPASTHRAAYDSEDQEEDEAQEEALASMSAEQGAATTERDAQPRGESQLLAASEAGGNAASAVKPEGGNGIEASTQGEEGRRSEEAEQASASGEGPDSPDEDYDFAFVEDGLWQTGETGSADGLSIARSFSKELGRPTLSTDGLEGGAREVTQALLVVTSIQEEYMKADAARREAEFITKRYQKYIKHLQKKMEGVLVEITDTDDLLHRLQVETASCMDAKQDMDDRHSAVMGRIREVQQECERRRAALREKDQAIEKLRHILSSQEAARKLRAARTPSAHLLPSSPKPKKANGKAASAKPSPAKSGKSSPKSVDSSPWDVNSSDEDGDDAITPTGASSMTFSDQDSAVGSPSESSVTSSRRGSWLAKLSSLGRFKAGVKPAASMPPPPITKQLSVGSVHHSGSV